MTSFIAHFMAMKIEIDRRKWKTAWKCLVFFYLGLVSSIFKWLNVANESCELKHHSSQFKRIEWSDACASTEHLAERLTFCIFNFNFNFDFIHIKIAHIVCRLVSFLFSLFVRYFFQWYCVCVCVCLLCVLWVWSRCPWWHYYGPFGFGIRYDCRGK